MNARRLLTRLVPIGGVAALLLTMAGAPTANATTYSSGAISIELTGDPVYFHGVSSDCSVGANANDPATLSGPLYIHVNTADETGHLFVQAGNAYHYNANYSPTYAGSDYTIPADGGGNFTCADASSGTINILVGEYDAGYSGVSDVVQVDLVLSNVD